MASSENKDIEIKENFPIAVRFDEFLYPDVKDKNRTLILLHGYGESKERIYQKLGSSLSGLARRILVLNAPFPAPHLGKSGYKEGYAWYFRSLSLNLTMIPPEACDPLFDEFIERCQLKNETVAVIGFSQGGFIMPYLARKIPRLEQMIGISCGVHPSDWLKSKKPKLNIIHADKDSLSDINSAEKQFADLGIAGPGSQFKKIEGGHEIDEMKIEWVKGFL